jgi:hypothetical protein
MIRFSLPINLAIGLLLLGTIGCGPSLLRPTGKITKGGAPLKLSDKGVMQIALYPESDKSFGAPEAVDWKPDGTFTVKGREGNGIVAGKYRVSVIIMDPYGGPNAKDILDGKMAKEKGPLVEVKDASEIVIDIDKK